MTNETGKILKALRLSRGLGQQQVADLVGAKSYTTVSKWESGENSPQGRDIKILSEFYKVSSDSILGIEHLSIPTLEFEYTHYPTLISAGVPLEVDGITEESVKKISIPDAIMGKWAGNNDIFITHITGESMNKVIPDKTMIAVKNVELNELKDGDIVVFSHNHEYGVKRFYKFDDKVIFRPDSTDMSFSDNEIKLDDIENLSIHGKVVIYIVEMD